MKHCGKSSLGAMTADAYALPFYDLDDFVLRHARAAGYPTVRALYRSAGRGKFQEYERAAAEELALFLDRYSLVAALGGGTVENPEAMELLHQKAILLYLEVEEDELFRRILGSGVPPFLEGDRPPKELFAELHARRRELYRRWADAVIELPAQSIEKNFSRLIAFISEHTDFREVPHVG
jgi:shikimate kinase